MGDVLTFTPRPKPAAPRIWSRWPGAALRASLEEAAQTALDAADRIIAVLDRMDGDADLEDGGDASRRWRLPRTHRHPGRLHARSDQDREAEAPETVLPEVAAEPLPALPRNGRGNVLAAAGVALLDMVGV